MPKAKNDLADEARALYRQGKLLKDIAEELEVPASTIRRWKSTYKWDNERSDKITNARIKEKPKKVSDNDSELTERQELFCLYYIENFNATKAYQRAYECDYKTAVANAHRMMVNDGIKIKIRELTEECLQEQGIESKLLNKRLMEKYIAIAFADIKDFMEFGNEDVEITLDNGDTKMIKVSNINIKNDYEVDGTIISEVSKGKDGIKVKLGDRLKAMKWLDDHIGLATEEQKARIELMKVRTNAVTGENESNEAIDRLDSILKEVKDIAINQEAE